MLGRIAIPAVAIAEPDFLLNLLTDPLFYVFLQVLLILLLMFLIVYALEARINSKLQELKSYVDKKIGSEVQSLAEKNEEIDSRVKDIEAKLTELRNRVDELEKRSTRRTKKTS